MSSISRKGVFFSFVITLAIFFLLFATLQLLGVIPSSLGSSELAILLLFAFIFLVSSLASIRYRLYGIYLEPLRKYMLQYLATVAIERWEVNVEVLLNGDAIVTNRIHGRVNYGVARWLSIGVWAVTPQHKNGGFEVEIVDLEKHRNLEPEMTLDESKYKRIRIRFDSPLERGDRFAIAVRYKLRHTFYFERMDYYQHSGFSSRELVLSILFPEDITIDDVYVDIGNEYGNYLEVTSIPKLVAPNSIRWEIRGALHENIYSIHWRASRKRGEPQSP